MKLVTPIMLSRRESEREGNLQQTREKSFSLPQEPDGARRGPGSVVEGETEVCLLSRKAPSQRSTMPPVTMILKK